MASLSGVEEMDYTSVSIHFDQILGRGAYGEVCRATCDQLPCAAKLLHSVLFKSQGPEVESVQLRKFWDECQVLKTTRHPNIIQYLGAMVDNVSGRPVLLMELMDESLTMMLKRVGSTLPYHLQIGVCHDVALALAFLHSKSIMHRDLSSNNVLLIAGQRAKIADFGVSTILDEHLSHLTKCPGSKVYMPPEALVDPPRYTSKLDCFSFGVLALQIATKNFPDPGPHAQLVSDPEYPTGHIHVFIPEIERRKSDIDLVGKNHPLLQIILGCLSDHANDRPSAQVLCDRLIVKRVHYLSVTGGTSCGIVGEESALYTTERLREQLESKTSLIERLQKTPSQTSDSVEDGMEEQIKTKRCHISGWMYEAAPNSFSFSDGVALFDVDKAYFIKKNRLYLYNGKKWEELINTHYQYPGLATISNKLVTVGGCNAVAVSRCIYTLHDDSSKMTWKEDLPMMPTARWSPACFATSSHLIVIGGFGYFSVVSQSVDVLDTSSFQWCTATNIPRLQNPQVVGCEDTLYLFSSESDSFFHCPLGDLLESIKSEKKAKKVPSSLWKKLQCLPCHQKGAVAVFQNQILAVGGENDDSKDLRLIHQYNKKTNWWDVVGEMPTARNLVLAGILGDDRIVCVGGQCDANAELKVVEMAQIWCR